MKTDTVAAQLGVRRCWHTACIPCLTMRYLLKRLPQHNFGICPYHKATWRLRARPTEPQLLGAPMVRLKSVTLEGVTRNNGPVTRASSTLFNNSITYIYIYLIILYILYYIISKFVFTFIFMFIFILTLYSIVYLI